MKGIIFELTIPCLAFSLRLIEMKIGVLILKTLLKTLYAFFFPLSSLCLK